jgi:hypothetical protein
MISIQGILPTRAPFRWFGLRGALGLRGFLGIVPFLEFDFGGGLNEGQQAAELQSDLHAAWAEPTEAAKGSMVTTFHAYTRAGQPWTDDPAAVREVAAILRAFPSRDGQQATYGPTATP